ncbi:hypothetical protein [Allobranchiibius sp. CTAmp26]|uniref:hypothetical protein n=1 Tax=Allobranchiibius sp. CTAmp26 TaxID=2815214 RepID=UPI001AA10D49|nr:hypothetical protein [Allobranchiibius sp. CTAmp26]MBO1754221.1 hypothetical protein [Allobranchiibius sp. CTAmp26]
MSVRQMLRTHPVLTACAGYVVLRVISALIIIWVGQHAYGHPSRDYFGVATQWDGQWYRRIVDHGYPATLPHRPDGSVAENEYAFLPLYPGLVRVLMWATGGSFPVVATTLSLVLGVAATAVLVVLLRRFVGPAAAAVAAILWAASPASPALQMAYTESLAMMLLGALLWALTREKWLLAAVLAPVVGLARPLGPPLVVVALVAAWLRWRAREDRPLPVGERVRIVVMVVSTALAGWIWAAYVGWRTGVRNGYVLTELAWQFTDKAHPFGSLLSQLGRVVPMPIGVAIAAAVGVGILALALGPWAQRLGWVLRIWVVAYLGYIAAAALVNASVVRYLLPAFPLAVVLIGAGRARPSGRQGSRAVGWAAAFVILQIVWAWGVLRGPGFGGAP